ncbi:hypothetical protein BDZ89DRAFT_1081578 [Hymenopellis radicata]|nr:hypothetical protein BDZ89DRAFT_1081578 [Hymenopellis radicata]
MYNCLWNLLSSNRTLSFSDISPYHMILTAGQFAIQGLLQADKLQKRDRPRNLAIRLINLIKTVSNLLGPNQAALDFSVQILSLLDNISDNLLSTHQAAILYESAISLYIRQPRLLGSYSPPFPLIQRVLKQGASHVCSHSQLNLPTCPICHNISDIMVSALASGLREAFSLFAEDEWMLIAATEATMGARRPAPGEGTLYNWGEELIRQYISSLRSLEERSDFLKYVLRPHNLVMAIIILVSSDLPEEPDRYEVIRRADWSILQFMQLCPRHPSWAECRAGLNAVVAWIRSHDSESNQPVVPPFPQGVFTGSAGAGSTEFWNSIQLKLLEERGHESKARHWQRTFEYSVKVLGTGIYLTLLNNETERQSQ